MPRYVRIPGGEKNYKSGKKWSKEELKHVLDLYLRLPHGVGIHENNPLIHEMSKYLERTVRSVEAQLIMFRNIQKAGDYGSGHMNKLCVELWKEYLDNIGNENKDA